MVLMSDIHGNLQVKGCTDQSRGVISGTRHFFEDHSLRLPPARKVYPRGNRSDSRIRLAKRFQLFGNILFFSAQMVLCLISIENYKERTELISKQVPWQVINTLFRNGCLFPLFHSSSGLKIGKNLGFEARPMPCCNYGRQKTFLWLRFPLPLRSLFVAAAKHGQ